MQNKSTNKKPYRITKVGAGHSQQEEGPSSPFVQYGYNDTILLDPKEVDAGKWDHLSPRSVAAGRTSAEDRALVNKQREAAGRAKLDQDDADPETAKDDGEPEEEPGEEAEPIDPAELEKLVKLVEDASGKKELDAARQAVIDADYFEEGTVPTTKAKLIQALVELQGDAE